MKSSLQPAAQHKRVIVHAALVYDGDGLVGAIHVETGNAFETAQAGLVWEGCECGGGGWSDCCG
jgi:hypothetical protein